MSNKHQAQFRLQEFTKLFLGSDPQLSRVGVKVTRQANLDSVLVPVMESWVEVPVGDRGAWVVAYRLAPGMGGQPVVAEVRVFPNEPGRPSFGRWTAEVLGVKAKVPRGGISARLLRSVRLGEHLRFAGQFLREIREKYGETLFESRRPLGRQGFAPPERTGRKRLGRKGRDDLFYARLAREYVKAIERGIEHPVAKIAKTRRLPRERLRDMIHAARRRGLLCPGQRGRSSGVLTDRCLRLLATAAASRGRSGRDKAFLLPRPNPTLTTGAQNLRKFLI